MLIGIASALIVQGQISDDRAIRARFFDLLKAKTTKSRAVEAVFARPDGRGQRRIGIDFATGAWYFASDTAFRGQRTDGSRYGGTSGVKSAREWGRGGFLAALSIVDYVPEIWNHALLEKPQMVAGVSHTDDTFVVEVDLPDDEFPVLPNITLTYDEHGVLRRAQRPDGGEAINAPLIYDPRTVDHVALPMHVNATSAQLVSYHRGPIDAAQFDAPRVEAMSSQMKFDEARSAAQEVGVHGGSTPVAGIPPFAETPLDRWRWPLFGVGTCVIFVGVGAIIWQRRRQ